MKSSNPPRNSMPISSQANQRASQQNNNPSVLNTQNLMGQTVLNTVYPAQSQVQNSKQISSTVKSTQIVNSQARSNNSAVNKSKATVNSIQSNQSNQPGSTMQSKLPTVSNMVKEDPVYPNSSSYPKQQSMYNKSINSQQQSVHPSQQQSMRPPSQQQSMRPSQQQSIHPSQQQSIHPSQHQSIQAQRQSMNNQVINSQQQQGSIRPGSQMGKQQNNSKNPSVKLSRKSSVRTSRNKSPPLIVRKKNKQIKTIISNFNSNNYNIKFDE